MAIEELDLLEKSSDHSCDVTVASLLAVPANTARSWISLVNISDVRIHYQLGKAATVTAGIPLNAAGGAALMDKNNPWRGEIYVIHGGAGNKRLCIVEVESGHG